MPTAPTLEMIEVKDLHPRGENLRQHVDGSDLVPSIQARGVLSPLLVSPRDEGGYWIEAGHRRHHGATLAKVQRIPCMIQAASEDDTTFTMLVENIMRTDLNPIEEAIGYKRLLDRGAKQAT